MGQRRKARECALQVLYMLDAQLDWSGPASSGPEEGSARGATELLGEQLRFFWQEFDGEPEVRAFAESLIHGVLRERATLDDLITRYSRNWRLERMARVDRNVLRLATYELKFLPEIPKRVTLNEAIELAKRFGAEDSGAFINGILDRVCQDLDKA
jgi:N utilization substance protein B